MTGMVQFMVMKSRLYFRLSAVREHAYDAGEKYICRIYVDQEWTKVNEMKKKNEIKMTEIYLFIIRLKEMHFTSV